jgi:CPA2 family monovalent cation:H+ antiporter-2
MPHNVSLITTLAGGFGLALVFGFIAARLKLPALVGYLVAGMVIGPYTPGFVGDLDIAAQLSEIGVMLLMFGVGLHFSIDDLMAVRKIALPGAVAQIAVATLMGMGVATFFWDWSVGAGLVFGLALSVASTVVLLKALEARGVLDSMNGHIALGWLIVEDLVMVVVLVLLPATAGILSGGGSESMDAQGIAWELAQTLAQVGAFVALMLVAGRRVFPWLLWQVASTGSRELFTLCVVAAALGIAYGATALFGVSFALGAFFAGMVLRESQFSQRAAEESLPLRDAFAVLFFVSVGMLFNPNVVLERPGQVLTVVAIIVVGKTIAAAAVVVLFRYPLSTALTVAASLAQIGEFSFILVAMGVSLKVLPAEGQSLVVAGALISIALNPLVFRAMDPVQRWLLERSELARRLAQRDDPLAELPATTEERFLARQVVLVGYGRVGRRIADELAAKGIPFVVAEQNRERVEALRAGGVHAVFGNAEDPATLIQAHIARAHMLVIATPDMVGVRRMIETARALNPQIHVAVRSHNEAEAQMLAGEGEVRVFLGEDELARSMVHYVESAPRHSAASPAPDAADDPALRRPARP